MRPPARQPSARRFSSREDEEEFVEGGVITALLESSRRPGRFEVQVDGRRAAVLSVESISRLGIHVGDAWTESLAGKAGAEGEQLRVFDRAMALLAVRARSARELRLSLLRKQEPEPLVDAAVARLLALGALNDEVFARQFVRARITRSGFSKRRLQAELARRGVSRQATDAAIAEVGEEESIDPAETLETLAAKKLKTLSKLDEPTRNRRLWAFLARRGYDGTEIRSTLAKLKSRE
jgi:regulatory protein